MEVTFLGTSSGTPTRERNVSGVALQLSQRREAWLFDCGEGTQHRILASRVRISGIRRVFLTHLHGDHLFGLMGLLTTLGLSGDPERVDVYGPEGLEEYVETSARLSGTNFSYPVAIHAVRPGTVFEDREYAVTAAPLAHRVPAYGYRVAEKPRPGPLDAGKALALGVPRGPLLGRLKEGSDVTLGDGRVVRAADVCGPPEPGRVFAYVTDTTFCEASVRLAKGADLVVHEATYGADVAHLAAERLHSTAAMAAEVARRAGARLLYLTHFSPRYGTPEALLAEARAIFPATEAAEDLLSVGLPRRLAQAGG